MVFLWFSHGFPMVSYGFPMVGPISATVDPNRPWGAAAAVAVQLTTKDVGSREAGDFTKDHRGISQMEI